MSNENPDPSFFKHKKVLVTGAAGFVGTHLTRRLVEAGANVRGTLHKNPLQRKEPQVEFLTADLTLPEDCAVACKDIDYVFMAAANSSGAAVMEKTPLVHLTPNIVMNARLLEAAYEAGVKKFCFISSNTVYPLTDFAVTEDSANFDFFEKYFIVGWMKRFSELMCQMYSQKIKQPMETLVIRPGNLYGPYDKYTLKESKVIAALIRRAVERQNPFIVWGDGLDIKDFLYIDDFIDGVMLAFQHDISFDILNIASGQPVSIQQVVKEILAATNNQHATVQYDPSQPTMIPKRLIDITKISSNLQWSPKTPLSDGLRSTIAWYREAYATRLPETRSL